MNVIPYALATHGEQAAAAGEMDMGQSDLADLLTSGPHTPIPIP